MLQENLGADLGFDLGLAAAPAPQNGLDGTADFFVNTFNIFKFIWFNMQPLRSAERIIRQSKVEQLSLFGLGGTADFFVNTLNETNTHSTPIVNTQPSI